MPVLLSLLITIVLIIVLIMKVRMNAAVAMFLGALFMGISTGLGAVKTVSTLTSGFGGTMAALGYSVGFGVMMGQMIAATGCVQSIANTLVKIFSKKRSDYALGTTGFIVSIPVFYDVGYVVLLPLAKTLSKMSEKSIAFFSGALVLGLGLTHTFVPPTPGPMTGAELLGIDVGVMILWGLIIGIPTFIIAMLINRKLLSIPGYFVPEKHMEVDDEYQKQQKELEEEFIKDEKTLPPFGLAILPIFTPIVLILLGTVTKAIMAGQPIPEIIAFLSDKSVAMLTGLLVSIAIALPRMNMKEVEKNINKSLSSIGTVLFITGTGAALGAVIQACSVGDALLKLVQGVNIPPILFAWLVAALLKVAQGSGTVAMITTVGMMVPMMAGITTSPVLIALAAFSGTLMGAHVNDSAFWITSKMSNLNTAGGFRVYSIPCAINAVVSLVLIFIASIFM